MATGALGPHPGGSLVYLSGHHHADVLAAAQAGHQLGLLAQPQTGYAPAVVAAYPVWAADNGCFAGEAFDEDYWLRWLRRMPLDNCLFATAPDVLGDPVATLERSTPWLPQLRAMHYRAALVAQDGLEYLAVPWDSFDVLFLGGSIKWKLAPGAAQLAAEALRQGKTVHMGRVNTRQRLRVAQEIGCASVDGTTLARGRDRNLPYLLHWLAGIQAQPTLGLNW